jgi:hypothetical protein
MYIKYIGHFVIRTPHRNLSLRHILHVPQASKNLAFVHRIASDNNVFLNFTLIFFIKDCESRVTLLQGKSKGGLYPLPCSTSSTTQDKQVLSTIKIPSTRLHARLGHLSSYIVRFVLNKNNLPFSNDVSVESVCDACQQAKCHQLPYPISTTASKVPLELIFSDVWSPTCDSVGCFKYYVSFIDDYSKFT